MTDQRWTPQQGQQWIAAQPWLVGCNFIPSTAINQLEMWQQESFDPETISRELGWAAGLGMNSVRVYLHDLLWHQDAAGFKDRIRRYLDIAGRNKLSTIFVLFDDCWHDNPKIGTQPAPTPGVHNSGWIRSPGTKAIQDETEWGRLADYVGGVVGAFRKDERVVMWDVYNEPGNNFLVSLSLPRMAQTVKLISLLFRHAALPIPSSKLLHKTFSWARQADPEQPLTAPTWYLTGGVESRLNRTVVELSDVITFHSYFDLKLTTRIVSKLRRQGKPLVCTEYLSRGAGSNFESHLPYFKEQQLGCYNWGLVSGKTQTIYSWTHFDPSGAEPPLWFHDLLRPDGSPYRKEEADLIRRLTQPQQ